MYGLHRYEAIDKNTSIIEVMEVFFYAKQRVIFLMLELKEGYIRVKKAS